METTRIIMKSGQGKDTIVRNHLTSCDLKPALLLQIKSRICLIDINNDEHYAVLRWFLHK